MRIRWWWSGLCILRTLREDAARSTQGVRLARRTIKSGNFVQVPTTVLLCVVIWEMVVRVSEHTTLRQTRRRRSCRRFATAWRGSPGRKARQWLLRSRKEYIGIQVLGCLPVARSLPLWHSTDTMVTLNATGKICAFYTLVGNACSPQKSEESQR